MSKRCKERYDVKPVAGATGADKFLGLANCAIAGKTHMAKGGTFLHATHNIKAVVAGCPDCAKHLSAQTQQVAAS